MKRSKLKIAGEKFTEYKAERKAWYKPEVVGTRFVNGKEYYVAKNGSLHLKSIFDAIWNPPRGRVLPASFKGVNASNKLAAIA